MGGERRHEAQKNPLSKVLKQPSVPAPIQAIEDPPAVSPWSGVRCPCAGGCSRCLVQQGGQPLAQEQRQRLETMLGHDFSNVRMHRGVAARLVTEAFDAQAVTRGTHIWFDSRQSGSPDDDRLLAHELTHVKQYETGALAGLPDGVVVPAAHRIERQAMTSEGATSHPRDNGVASPSANTPATSRRAAPVLLKRNRPTDDTESQQPDEFSEEDPALLLNELQSDELWTAPEESRLRQVLTLAQDHMDEAIAGVIANRWMTHGGLLASMGFGPAGEVTDPNEQTPGEVDLFIQGLVHKKPEEMKNGRLGGRGFFNLGLRVAIRRWNKKRGARLGPLTIAEVQKLLGNSILGVNLDGLEDELVEGVVSLELNPRMGFIEIALEDGVIPSLTWLGDSANELFNITALGVRMDHFLFRAEWPRNRRELGAESLHMERGEIRSEQIVVSKAGVEWAVIHNLIVDDLAFNVEMGQFRKGQRVNTLAMAQHIQDQLSLLAPVIPAAVGALVSTLNPQSASAPAAFIDQLAQVVQNKLGESLLLQSERQAVLHADSVTVDNMAVGSVDAGFEFLVHTGARPLALLEQRSLEAQEILTTEDELRLWTLRRIGELTDREQADHLLEILGLDPDNLVMQVRTHGLVITKPDETDEQRGLNFPAFPIGIDSLEGDDPIVMTVRVPGIPADQEQSNEVLYTVNIDATGSIKLPGEQDTRLKGLPLVAGPLSLAGVSGSATVFNDGSIGIEANIASARFQTIAWGRYIIRATDGVASDIKLNGMVERGPDGFLISQETPITIIVGETTGSQIDITITDLLEAKLFGSRLLGMSVVLSRGELPELHIASGSMTGFEGLLNGVFGASSESRLTFEDFDTTLIIDSAGLPFSFGKLISGDIDWTLYGEHLIAKRLDGVPIVTGALGAVGAKGRIEELGDERIKLVMEADSVPFGKVDWGGYRLDAIDGVATDVVFAMALEKSEVSGETLARDIAIDIQVAKLNATQLGIAVPDVLRASLRHPVLRGLHAQVSKGGIPGLRIDSGVVSGFEGVMHDALNASSDSPLSFTGFDTSALIDLGRFPFTFEQLISGNVDVNAFGRDLSVERFQGPLSGELTDQQSGSIELKPDEPLVLGPLSLHLGARSENLGPVELGWGSLTLQETATLEIAWQALPVAPDRPTGALSVTLNGLYAEEAIATGLQFTTRLAGAEVNISMTAQGEARIFGLKAPELQLEIAEDYFKVDGLITGESLAAQGLLARLGERLRVEFEARSDRIFFEAFSDGDDQFRIDELVLSGNKVFRASPQGNKPINTWTFSIAGDLWGTIGEQGIAGHLTGLPGNVGREPAQAKLALGVPMGEAEVRTENLDFLLAQEQAAFDLGPGGLEKQGIRVTFGQVTGIGKLGQPGDTPTSLGHLSLDEGAYSGNFPIIKLADIQLTNGTIEIDDLSQWIDESDFQHLDEAYLKEFADAVSGRAAFTIELRHMLDPRANVVINPGRHDAIDKIVGTYTWEWAKLKNMALKGSLLTSPGSGSAIDTLYVFDSLPLSGSAKWPPKQPITLDLEDKLTAELSGSYNIYSYSDVDFDLLLSATNIPLPGNGVLRVEPSGGQQIGLHGEPQTSDSKHLSIRVSALDPVSVRALLFGMFDFEASGIHVKEARDLEVEYDGLAVKRVSGEIVSAEIRHLDIAEIPALDPAARPVSSIPTLFFETNSTNLSKNPAVASEQRLANVVALIKEQTSHGSGWRAVVNGYAGNEDDAVSISRQRAVRVAQILNANNIANLRIEIVGHGADNSRPGEFNQRVEIILIADAPK